MTARRGAILAREAFTNQYYVGNGRISFQKVDTFAF